MQFNLQEYRKFHIAQNRKGVDVQTAEGVNCWQQKNLHSKSRFVYSWNSSIVFSTVLMLAIPAQMLVVKKYFYVRHQIKRKNKSCYFVHCKFMWNYKIYKVGGIQAIAGMTFGTTTRSI
jgi:histidinol dehydrogenase